MGLLSIHVMKACRSVECILVMNTVLNAAGLLGRAFYPRLCMATMCKKKHWLIKSCADRNLYRVQSDCFF